MGLRESAGTEAGSVVGEPLETCMGRVGLLICFDVSLSLLVVFLFSLREEGGLLSL